MVSCFVFSDFSALFKIPRCKKDVMATLDTLYSFLFHIIHGMGVYSCAR